MAVHIWDVRNNKAPVRSFNVTDYLEKKLCEVYESETIFDKFDLQVSPDSTQILTGAYNSNAHVIDINTGQNCTIDVKFMEKRGKGVGNFRSYRGKRMTNPNNLPIPQLDMKRKIQLCAWHPKENTFAVAKHNLLFIYTEKRSPLVYPSQLRNNLEQHETLSECSDLMSITSSSDRAPSFGNIINGLPAPLNFSGGSSGGFNTSSDN